MFKKKKDAPKPEPSEMTANNRGAARLIIEVHRLVSPKRSSPDWQRNNDPSTSVGEIGGLPGAGFDLSPQPRPELRATGRGEAHRADRVHVGRDDGRVAREKDAQPGGEIHLHPQRGTQPEILPL